MKSVTEMHREGFEQALRQALGTSQAALRRQALDRAATHLIHPGFVLESTLLADHHPWRREALVISDAFEAVTNGMEEPGVLEALESLDPDSPFVPWRHLVLALHFFYEGLDEAVEAHLSQIPATSPLRVLRKALEALGRGANGSTVPRLLDQVAQPDSRILPWVQDVAEGLETDNEALFWGALGDWLDAVAETAPNQARSAVLWAWNQLEWRDFDEAVLLDLGAKLWGPAESYRLAALGTLPWDPEGAALLWLRFLLTSVREGWDESSVREARALLDRFHQAALAEEPASAEWTATWLNLSRAWNDEAMCRRWNDLALEVALPVQEAPSPRSTGQLDLFSL